MSFVSNITGNFHSVSLSDFSRKNDLMFFYNVLKTSSLFFDKIILLLTSNTGCKKQPNCATHLLRKQKEELLIKCHRMCHQIYEVFTNGCHLFSGGTFMIEGL